MLVCFSFGAEGGAWAGEFLRRGAGSILRRLRESSEAHFFLVQLNSHGLDSFCYVTTRGDLTASLWALSVSILGHLTGNDSWCVPKRCLNVGKLDK